MGGRLGFLEARTSRAKSLRAGGEGRIFRGRDRIEKRVKSIEGAQPDVGGMGTPALKRFGEFLGTRSTGMGGKGRKYAIKSRRGGKQQEAIGREGRKWGHTRICSTSALWIPLGDGRVNLRKSPASFKKRPVQGEFPPPDGTERVIFRVAAGGPPPQGGTR